ncbi:MAG TPA: type II secretion system protein [Mollicutes bacterium]|nr:type II secretion system protein [Mollicutes bacterium]
MKNKGFTMVELLSVIIILGIILSMVTIGVNSYLNKSQEASFNTLVESIKASTELYLADNSYKYPELETPGSVFEIELKELVEKNYITSKLTDERKKQPIPLTTKISITVIATDNIKIDFLYE